MADEKFLCIMLSGGVSVNLNHLKSHLYHWHKLMLAATLGMFRSYCLCVCSGYFDVHLFNNAQFNFLACRCRCELYVAVSFIFHHSYVLQPN